MHEAPLMRVVVMYIGWTIVALALGFVLAQYTSGGMVIAFLQKLPGCL
jgi:hypothetical protein